jgi:hypothetical protein
MYWVFWGNIESDEKSASRLIQLPSGVLCA